MKYSLLALLFPLYSISLVAQNVGVGNTNPAEKLDVTGNMKISGEIKPGGNSGQNGQVLMNNGSGGMNWANLCDYKNQITFMDTSVQYLYWNVPAGVTKIWIELWGGGGAGFQAGGGGGGYLSIFYNVTPGEQLTFSIGKGGKDNPQVFAQFTVAESGGTTRVDYAGQYYLTFGGNGAIVNTVSGFPRQIPGDGGTFLTSVPATTSPRGSFYFQKGQSGGPVKFEYNTISSNQYFQTRLYGYGGAAAYTAGYTAIGAIAQYSVIITPSSSTLSNYSTASSGVFPGGGGGGGEAQPNDTRAGANGMVIVHY